MPQNRACRHYIRPRFGGRVKIIFDEFRLNQHSATCNIRPTTSIVLLQQVLLLFNHLQYPLIVLYSTLQLRIDRDTIATLFHGKIHSTTNTKFFRHNQLVTPSQPHHLAHLSTVLDTPNVQTPNHLPTQTVLFDTFSPFGSRASTPMFENRDLGTLRYRHAHVSSRV